MKNALLLVLVIMAVEANGSPPEARQIAIRYGVPAELLEAVCSTESDWRNVNGDSGRSIGLCQVQPETALTVLSAWKTDLTHKDRLSEVKNNLWDKQFNMTVAALYLKKLMFKYDNDVTLVILAYNTGESSRYVKHIQKVYSRMAPKKTIMVTY